MKINEIISEAFAGQASPVGSITSKRNRKKTAKDRVEELVNEGWPEMIGSGIAFAWMTKELCDWLIRSVDTKKIYKVFVNGNDVSTKKLLKREALAVIDNLIKREHDINTQFTIVNTETNKIIFRKIWHAADENPGWYGDHYFDTKN